jgi:carbonic anhydrase
MLDIVYRYDPSITKPPPPKDAREACVCLHTGNGEFARVFDVDLDRETPEPRVFPIHPGSLSLGKPTGTPPPQTPFAIVLGCSDARVPTELIFNRVQSELFVIRVAGNVLGSDCLGSIQYAVEHLHASVRLVVVLGHRACGAVTAAVDSFLDPSKYPHVASSQPLQAIVDRIFVAVRGSTAALVSAWGADVVQRPGYRQAVIETSVTLNAALTAWTLCRELRDSLRPGMEVVYGVYDLLSRYVRVPVAGAAAAGTADAGLEPPPTDADSYRELAQRVASSDYASELLNST